MIEIGFFLKKFATFFVEPFGAVLTLFALALYFLYERKEGEAKAFLLGGVFSLLLFSYPPFANFLVLGLENQYPKYDYKREVGYVHVLGNGHNVDPTQPISSQLSDGGLKRVIEGVLIYKKNTNSKLIFTGYEGDTNASNAAMNASLAFALGAKENDVVVNGEPLDTKEEAIFAKSLIGEEPFALVTSATHMPRAMTLFRSLGMNPIAAPTSFYKRESGGWLRKPTPGSFRISTIAIHEYIGLLWTKLKD